MMQERFGASGRRKWAAVCGMALIALGPACRGGGGAAGGEWEAGDFRLAVDGRGCVAAMADRRTGVDYQVSEVESPLLALRVDGRMLAPSSFRPGRRSTALLDYPGRIKARLRIEAKPTHVADAGFGFVTSFGTLDANGAADEIFAAIRAWEGARRSKAFSDEQRRRIAAVLSISFPGFAAGGSARAARH